MKKQEKAASVQEKITVPKEESVKHLLASREKQIKALREDIAGFEETARLTCAFMALLSLSLIGDGVARGAVSESQTEEGMPSLRISRQGLTDALDKWQMKIRKEEDAYRILFQEKHEGQ